MRYIGIALIFIGAYLLSRKNGERERERLALLLGYCEFVREMRSRVSVSLEPVARWIGHFRCEALERVGFLGRVRGGERLSDAFSASMGDIDKVSSDALNGLFSRTGATLGEEIERIDAALRVLNERTDAERIECEKRVRIFSVIALAASAGVGILVL